LRKEHNIHHTHVLSNARLASEHKVSWLELNADAYFSEQEAEQDYAAWQAELEAQAVTARRTREQQLTAHLAALSDQAQDDWFSAQVEWRDQQQAHAHYCGDCRAVGLCEFPGCQELIVNVCPDCLPTTDVRFRPAALTR
jgi:hypothetical protein